MHLGPACSVLWLTWLAWGIADEVKVVCYFTGWDDWRNGTDRTEVENMDPNLCTHLIYAFVDITEDGNVDASATLFDQPDHTGTTGFQMLNKFRKRNEKLKILVSTGGWYEGSAKYSKISDDASLRSKYAKNVVDFLVRNELDGFDIYWLFKAADREKYDIAENYVLLLKELREHFDERKLILIASAQASEVQAGSDYDIPGVAMYAHFIVLKTLYHKPSDSTIGHSAPLYRAARETSSVDWSKNIMNTDMKSTYGEFDSLKKCALSADSLYILTNRNPGKLGKPHSVHTSSNATLFYWLNHGVPAEKLLLTVRFNGVFYYLNNSAERMPGALKSTKKTDESSFISYSQICAELKSGTWTTAWDEEQRVPYAYKGNEWMSYDNDRSLTEKVKYVRAMGLGGVMGWCVNWDDPHGECGEPYPNLKAVNRAIRESGSPPEADTTDSMKLYEKAKKTCTTLDIKYVRNPKDCAKFWICYEIGDNDFDAEPFSCGNGLHFDTKKTACRSKDSVKCN